MKKFAKSAWSLAVSSAVVSLGCSSGEAWNENVRTEEQPILNGDLAAAGEFQNLGPVRLQSSAGGLCSGTLISNQYVLTARHCVRTWDGVAWAAAPHAWIDVLWEGPTAAQMVRSTTFFEPPGTRALPNDDFAVLRLNTPMEFEGSNDSFHVPIYSGTAANLLDQEVLCMGYGMNTEANFNGINWVAGTGAGVLRSAVNEIATTLNETMTIDINSDGQLATGGDSGGTCYFNDQVTGTVVRSNGVQTPDGDLNGNGQIDSSELMNRTIETYTAPWDLREFVLGVIRSELNVEYDLVPSVDRTVSLAEVHTPAEGAVAFMTITGGDKASGVLEDGALRSGFVRVHMSEPPRMMCPVLHATAGIAGSVDVHGTCLGDGVVSVLL